MKKKLIACAILSAVSFISMLIGIALTVAHNADNNLKAGRALILIIQFGCWIANLVMGILVLSTGKSGNQSNRGMQIATGVLSILGGCFGANIIVASIAVSKEKDKIQEDQE